MDNNINEFNNNSLAVTSLCDSLNSNVLRDHCLNSAAWIIKLKNESFAIMCNSHKEKWINENKTFEFECIPFTLELANQMQKRIEELYA